MTDVRQPSKPNEDISRYEWERTPTTVKTFINHLEELLEQKRSQLNKSRKENQWLREQLDLRIEKSYQVAPHLLPEIILWAMIGFILTISSTFIEASTISLPSLWSSEGITTQTLGISLQIGAVLLTGCLGGKNAALLSQVFYLICGLLGAPIFDRGGGWFYVLEPNFGYLLGFIAGGWVCGYLAFQKLASINRLFFSCIAGLITIHLIGILYMIVLHYFYNASTKTVPLFQEIYLYSLQPFLGQLAVICAIVIIGFLFRKLMTA